MLDTYNLYVTSHFLIFSLLTRTLFLSQKSLWLVHILDSGPTIRWAWHPILPTWLSKTSYHNTITTEILKIICFILSHIWKSHRSHQWRMRPYHRSDLLWAINEFEDNTILLQLQPVTPEKCKNLTNFGSEVALRFAKYTQVAHSIPVRRFKLTLLGY